MRKQLTRRVVSDSDLLEPGGLLLIWVNRSDSLKYPRFKFGYCKKSVLHALSPCSSGRQKSIVQKKKNIKAAKTTTATILKDGERLFNESRCRSCNRRRSWRRCRYNFLEKKNPKSQLR